METKPHEPTLKRSLSLSWVVLYGLGVTIGAGIYVLLGATVARAGAHAPLAFVFAAVVMVFCASSFAELAGRYPVSAGEAAYVRAGFQSRWLALAVGGLVILSGVLSSAAITVGSVGYLQEFVDISAVPLVVFVVLSMGAIAAWGIMESVIFASLFTLVEAGALLFVVAAGFSEGPTILLELPAIAPSIADSAAWVGVASAGLLAFFAFIGFEDIVNLAEEAKDPKRLMPWAIFLTLAIGTLIYVLVAFVAVSLVPIDELGASRAPISLIFGHITGVSPIAITVIAIVATLNGVIIQIIMASRVLYGLAKQGSLPATFATIHSKTRTPINATVSIVAVVLILALMFPVERLAEMTSRVVLSVFLLVNLSLVRIKLRHEPAPDGVYEVGLWVPVAGFVSCTVLLVLDLV